MRGNEMLDAVGYLPPKMVEAADNHMKRRMWLRRAAIPACVCLILGGFAAARMLTAPAMDIRINSLGSRFDDFSAYIDILAEMYTGLPEEAFGEVRQAFESVTGIRYASFTTRIPAEFELNRFYAILTPAKADGSTEEAVRDYVFEYTAKEGGTMKLAVSAVGKPVRCVILPDGAYEPSCINGTEMWIFAAGNEYLAEFSHNTLHYSIETDGISEELLRELLGGIVVD